MKSIEVTAKKVNDAIEQGLKELGVKLDDVNVEVLETGGLFRKAKVRLTVDEPEKVVEPAEEKKPEKATAPAPAKQEKPAKPVKAETPAQEKPAKVEKPAQEKSEKPAKPAKTEKTEKIAQEKPAKTEKAEKPTQEKPEKKAEKKKEHNAEVKKPAERREADTAALAQACEFVKELVKRMGFEADVAVKADDPEVIEITAPQGDDSLIIGRHGETLSAMQYLAETSARAEKHHINIVVDCNGYRDRRAASLSAMARRKADECVRRNRKIKLEPMERIDRRTVHFALGEDGRVTTASEGKEPYRCVVIIPKK